MRTHCQLPSARATLRTSSGSGVSPKNTRRPGSSSSASSRPFSSYIAKCSVQAPGAAESTSSRVIPIIRAVASLA